MGQNWFQNALKYQSIARYRHPSRHYHRKQYVFGLMATLMFPKLTKIKIYFLCDLSWTWYSSQMDHMGKHHIFSAILKIIILWDKIIYGDFFFQNSVKYACYCRSVYILSRFSFWHQFKSENFIVRHDVGRPLGPTVGIIFSFTPVLS